MHGSPNHRRKSYQKLLSSLGRACSIVIISLPQITLAAAPDDVKNETTDAVKSTQNAQKLFNLSKKLDELKDTGNAFAPSMGEVYLELAEHYFQQAKFKAATDAFSKALHLARINEGLYHGKQLQISDRLVASLTANRKWEDAFKQQQFNHWLGNRHLADKPQEHRALLQRLAEWHMKVFIRSGKALTQHNNEAQKLYQQYITTLDDHESNSVSDITPVLKGLLAANFYQFQAQQQQTRQDIGLSIGQRRLRQLQSQQTHRDINPAGSRQSQVDQQERLNYSNGREIFTRVLSIYNAELQAKMPATPIIDSDSNQEPPLKPTPQASQAVIPAAKAPQQADTETSDPHRRELIEGRILALIELGDWNQLFLKHTTATMLYRQAYNQADTAMRLKYSLFKTPTEIPVLPPALLMAKGNAAKKVVLSFDISDKGKTYNIDVAEHSPTNSVKYQALAIRRAKKLRFRPAMNADGRLTRSSRVERVFSFP